MKKIWRTLKASGTGAEGLLLCVKAGAWRSWQCKGVIAKRVQKTS